MTEIKREEKSPELLLNNSGLFVGLAGFEPTTP